MKRFAQLILFSLLVIIGLFVKYKYFKPAEVSQKNTSDLKDETPIENKNNLIKNLTYDLKLEDNSQYIITSEISEISFTNNVEIVTMQKVIAKFIDKNGITMKITGDNAIFNKDTYNTNFDKNVKITYLDNVVLSEKLDLNFSENIVTIYDNVIYEGINGIMKTDNIIINLITKNAEIFMNTPQKKVEVISKE